MSTLSGQPPEIVMLKDSYSERRRMRRMASDVRLPSHIRYAAAVYIDCWNEIIDELSNTLRTLKGGA